MERAESEQRLQKSEEQLRLAVEAGAVGLWDVDPVNDKLYWPARVKAMFGISHDVPVSMADFHAGLHPADREAIGAAFAAALDPGKRALYDVEYRAIGAEDRIVRWVAARGRGIFDADGTCVRVLGTAIDITTRKLHEERLKLLLAELNHRVKNTLATVQSFAMQTLRNASSVTEAHAAFDARLIALSKAHDVLVREHWEGAGLHEVVSGALAPYSSSHQASRVSFAGPEIRLQPKAALALSMALHELATNAVKYGALSNGAGDVEVSWRVDPTDGKFQLRWREAGGPPVVAPRRRGFGSRLIEQGLSQDIAGEVDLSFNADGVACTIQTSLDEIRGEGIRIPGPYEENAFREA
jgi:PAS domain S-box-containing protein